MKVLLIDFDGTLFDTVPRLYEVYLRFLDGFGVVGSASEFQSFSGATIPQFVTALSHRYALPGDLVGHYYQQVAQMYATAPLFPGSERMLRKATASGIRCAVVTASQQPLVERALARCGIADAFTQIVTAVGLAASKPDPEIYYRALAAMESDPQDCLAIEDSPQGVTAAERAGIPTLAFGTHWTNNTRNVIRSWDELDKYLG
jgi:HAD superfamily hydrolase (TIGR01509 family)